jgi:hypothetical protein
MSDAAPPARRATVPRYRAPLVVPSMSDAVSPPNSLTAVVSKEVSLAVAVLATIVDFT